MGYGGGSFGFSWKYVGEVNDRGGGVFVSFCLLQSIRLVDLLPNTVLKKQKQKEPNVRSLINL